MRANCRYVHSTKYYFLYYIDVYCELPRMWYKVFHFTNSVDLIIIEETIEEISFLYVDKIYKNWNTGFIDNTLWFWIYNTLSQWPLIVSFSEVPSPSCEGWYFLIYHIYNAVIADIDTSYMKRWIFFIDKDYHKIDLSLDRRYITSLGLSFFIPT